MFSKLKNYSIQEYLTSFIRGSMVECGVITLSHVTALDLWLKAILMANSECQEETFTYYK